MARAKGIIAYGTDLDREKLAVLAQLNGQSGSEWIVDQIRTVYRQAFGEAAPDFITKHHNT
jgi:hypothetical protein